MTDKKWKCTTFVVKETPPNVHWFHRWNPLALCSHIRYLEERIACLGSDNDEYVKRIETLEDELRRKESECYLSDECAKLDLEEKEKALGLMRSEIHAAIGLLEKVAKVEEPESVWKRPR